MTFVAENAKGDKDAPSYFGGVWSPFLIIYTLDQASF